MYLIHTMCKVLFYTFLRTDLCNPHIHFIRKNYIVHILQKRKLRHRKIK